MWLRDARMVVSRLSLRSLLNHRLLALAPQPPLAPALLARPDLKRDRGADEAELRAEAALDKALVAGVELATGEQHERGRRGGGLGAEEHLGLLAAADRVRVLGDQTAQERVQLAGRDPGLPALEGLLQRGDDPVDVPAGAGGQVDPRRPLHLHEVALDLAIEVVAALLVDQVPLVERDHQRATGVTHGLDDSHVLFGDRLRAVDDQHGDLGALDRGLGAQGRVVLVARCGLHPLADAGGVDEPPGLSAELDELVDRVDRRTGCVVHDHPVLTRELVQQRGLANVRATDDGDTARAANRLEVLGWALGQRSEYGVQQVARAAPVQRGDRHRLAQTKVPQPVGLGFGAQVVHLVRREYDGLAGLAEDPDDRLVMVGDPDPGVDHEHHGVGDVHGDLGLGPDALGEPARVRVPAAGVHDREGATVPVGVVGDPVAGDAGLVLDHGLPTPDDAVDQSRLAHVRAADDGQDGDAHIGGSGGVGVGSHALFFSRLGPNGPGKVMPVASSAVCIVVRIPSVTNRADLDTSCFVRGHGRRSSRTGSPKVIAMRLPRGGTEPSEPPGIRVPRNETGTTGAPVTRARYAAPARGEVMSPAPRVPSGNTRTAPPSRSAFTAIRIADTSTWKRSSGIWP